ncbi:MAG: hypothetical protein ACRD8Z_13535 [Nitrososphaeraceae archaeon]
MTISEIVIKEFTCNRCGHKWINRFKGKDKPIPKRCSKCKSHNWNRMGGNIAGIEKSHRARIRGYKSRYANARVTWLNRSMENCWDGELAEKFLDLNPRPTVEELRLVLQGSRIGFNSKDSYKAQGLVPDPLHPGKLKYNTKEYQRIILMEAEKRKEIMRKIIQERTA